jgi:hypothetical protein
MEDIITSDVCEESRDSWNEFTDNIPCQYSSLITLHVNIRSILKNFAQLEYIISHSSRIVDIVVLTETNISNITHECVRLFELEGYQMYYELQSNRRGGGIIIYVHNKVKFTRYSVCTRNFECIVGMIEKNNKLKFELCAVYRPPNLSKSSFVTELKLLLSNSSLKNNYVLLGDFNINIKDYNNNLVCQYLNMLYEKSLNSGISQYTRIAMKNNSITKSCIDHIFIRNASVPAGTERAIKTAVVNNALADHFITCLAFIDNTNYRTTAETVLKLDHKRVQIELAATDWSQGLSYDSPEEILNFILSKFSCIYDNCQYETNVNQSQRKTCIWVNKKVTKMCTRRDELFKIWYKDQGDANNRLIYNKYRNRTCNYINNLKNNHIKNEVSRHFRNSRKVWEIINKVSGKIAKSIDEIITSAFKNQMPRDIANNFAMGFRENVNNICTYCNNPMLDEKSYVREPDMSMRLSKAKEDVVFSIIRHLNDKKSPGIDCIRPVDIKYVNSAITPIITHLINSCINRSNYPDKLKIGIVRPIHKKGKYNDINNYRPITILSCIDKIIEKYFGHEINKYLTKNNIIHGKQYGFQKEKNTSQLLSKFTNEINQHLNDKKYVLAVFIDFSKAFDTLRYDTLFSKLWRNGIQGPLLEFFKKYHTNRYTAVKVNESLSDLIKTDKGSAQGSIFAPTEYILYVNDMPNIFQMGSVYQFADDTCLLVADRDIQKAINAMQNNFDLLCKWAHDVGLIINYSKTKIMNIHSTHLVKTPDPVITAHGHQCLHYNNHNEKKRVCTCEPLELVHEHMYLGLIIDTHFNWGPHINRVCNKLRSILAKLAILKYKLPYNILRMLYMSLAQSVIGYGLSSYGRTFKTYIDKIYRVQTSLIKTIIPNSVKKKHLGQEELFKYCKIINIYNHIKIEIVSEEMDNLKSLIKTTRREHLRKLVYLPRFVLPKCKNVYGKRTWEYLLPNILNQLPTDIFNSISDNPHKCKRTMKALYL